jgi:hypothetical protein
MVLTNMSMFPTYLRAVPTLPIMLPTYGALLGPGAGARHTEALITDLRDLSLLQKTYIAESAEYNVSVTGFYVPATPPDADPADTYTNLMDHLEEEPHRYLSLLGTDLEPLQTLYFADQRSLYGEGAKREHDPRVLVGLPQALIDLLNARAGVNAAQGIANSEPGASVDPAWGLPAAATLRGLMRAASGSIAFEWDSVPDQKVLEALDQAHGELYGEGKKEEKGLFICFKADGTRRLRPPAYPLRIPTLSHT